MEYTKWIAGEGEAAACGIYPRSVRRAGDTTVCMANAGDKDVLLAVGSCVGFAGERGEAGGKTYTAAPLTHENAELLRRLFPFTAPVPVLSYPRTVGVGDRLGIAGPGHLRVFAEYDALPVLAQQSIRELQLTGRRYEDVLDAASFAVFREGFERGFGADGDHLKKAEDVAYALGLGFTMITLDCSEHIRGDVEAMGDAQAIAAAGPGGELEKYYLNRGFDLGEGLTLRFDRAALARIRLIYGGAVDFAAGIYEKFFAQGGAKADFELSIDETATPTTPLQHFFVANELSRRGVHMATMAPRFCGEFQKGVDYIGDLAQFSREMEAHAIIARHFGYKISVHSGSDKFSVFACVGEKTRGVFHVKTAGTNWLEAMGVAAQKDPALYRAVHKYALEAFPEAKKYYHVTTDLTKIPDVDSLTDAQLPGLFAQNDARQLIHITYGLILGKKDADGAFVYRDRLYALWRAHAEAYADALYRHIGRHLATLNVPKR